MPPRLVSRSLPTNFTDRPQALFQLRSGSERIAATADLAGVTFEAACPVREFCAWPGKRNYEGLWWSSTTRSHIPFESLFERDALMAFDFDGEVIAMVAQPMAFLWPRGGAGQPSSHVPDLFVRLASGDGCVVDVRPAELIDDRAQMQFSLTQQVCTEIGWEYRVFTGLNASRRLNMRWLSGYRHDRFLPSVGSVEAVVSVFALPCSLRVGHAKVSRMVREPRDLLLANIYSMLWSGRLRADLDSGPLTLMTRISS